MTEKQMKKIDVIQEAIETDLLSLSVYEQEFIDDMSIRKQKHPEKELTWKQIKFLNNIFDKVE